MAKDIVARALALDKSSGGDSYTKAETDTLLAGKADLIDGKVPAAQLPSYVDDVLEYESVNSFPVIGETGKIYVATDTNKTYRWSGSGYVEISESLALGETASTAYPGDKGKANADAITKKPGEITTGKQYTIDGQTVTAGTGAEAFNDLANNKASGPYSHAEGTRTTAVGNQSHAEGGGTTASGGQSHAEGGGTTASGENSHAEGAGTRASNINSHAEGAGTIASGSQSHAEGNSTKASSANQHAQGKFNVEDANGTFAFIIGNGTGNNARHNAIAIDWSGLIYVNGSETGVDVSALAPQSTTYTKSEVDTALASKLNTSDVDASLSSTSTNPVQNKAVQAPVARLVDAGAKNLLKNTAQTQTVGGVTFTINSDGSITANGTKTNNDWLFLSTGNSLKAGSYVLTSGGVSGSGTGMLVVVSTTDSLGAAIMSTWTTSGVFEREFTEDYTGLYFAIRIASGTVCNNVVFKPMLCTAEDYAISQVFVPYSKSNYELTQDVEPIPRLVDAGAKNLLDASLIALKQFNTSSSATWIGNDYTYNGITYSVNDDGTITVSGTATGASFLVIANRAYLNSNVPRGRYAISGCPTGGGASGATYRIYCLNPSTQASGYTDTGGGYVGDFYYDNSQDCNIAIGIGSGCVIEIPIVFKPMLCTAEDYAISPEFVPYTPSNRELWEKVNSIKRTYKVPISSTPVNNIYFGVQMFPFEFDSVPSATVEVQSVGQGGVSIDPSKFTVQINKWGFRIYTTDPTYAGLIPDVVVS